MEYDVSWTALHSVHPPDTWLIIWIMGTKDARHFGAAADRKDLCKSVYPQCCGRERRTLHTFEGHCTSKNGDSPELKLIKAPLLETSMWATAGNTSDSPFFTVQCKIVTNHDPTTDRHTVKLQYMLESIRWPRQHNIILWNLKWNISISIDNLYSTAWRKLRQIINCNKWV